MTCCVGMLATDGLVMAADTRQTYGEFEINTSPKLTIQAGGKVRLIMSGSGLAHLVEYTEAEISKVARQTASIDHLEDELRGLMERIYSHELAVYPAEQREKDVTLLVACQFIGNQRPALFAIDSTTVNRVSDTRVIGEERVSDIARQFWSMNLTVDQAGWACRYVINEAKNISSYVGGNTGLMSFTATGEIRFDDGTIGGAHFDQFMTRFTSLARRLFIGVVPASSDRLHQAELDNAADLLRFTRDELNQACEEFRKAAERESRVALLAKHRIRQAIEQDNADREKNSKS